MDEALERNLMRKIKSAIILSAAALAGCQTTGGTKHEGAYRSTGPVPRVEDPEAMRALSEAADRASKSLRLLASAKSAEAQRKITPAAHERLVRAETSVPPGWERLTKLDYTGAGNLLIRRLATSAGYRFYESGRRPVLAPLVEVRAEENMRLIDLLRDVVAQLPDTVRINVYPQTRTVVMSYREIGSGR